MSAPTVPPQAGRFRLRNADAGVRGFLVAFLVMITIGYAIGILFVDHTSGGTREGLAEQFRGSGESAGGGELRYEKGPDEMYIFLHNHILSLSLIFFAVGGIFSFSSIAKGGVKAFLMIEPLVAIGTTFGGIWLMRFVSPAFSTLVVVSGVTMLLCYATMIVLLLVELLAPRR